MNRLPLTGAVLCIAIAAIFLLSSPALAADNHVVTVSGLKWVYNGKSSSSAQPIMIDDLKVGDTIEFQIPSGGHGVITIKGLTPPFTEIKDPVLACGEAAGSKPKAVLKEVCPAGGASKFGIPITGTLKLEVMTTFKDPVNFYCVVHKASMPGVFKLKPATPALAADNHVVTVSGLKWVYNGKSSSSTQPIMIDDLKVADTIEFQIPAGGHGVITIKRATTPPITEIKDPVLACGEAPGSKPNAVLREVCPTGGTSKFGIPITGTLKLEVMTTFKDPVDFYCVVHKASMPGTFKLKPVTPGPANSSNKK